MLNGEFALSFSQSWHSNRGLLERDRCHEADRKPLNKQIHSQRPPRGGMAAVASVRIRLISLGLQKVARETGREGLRQAAVVRPVGELPIPERLRQARQGSQ